MNAEQASKRAMWEPTRLNIGEGRRCRDVCLLTLSGEDRAIKPCGTTGVVAMACCERKPVQTREAPAVQARDLQPDTREGAAGPVWGGGEVRSSVETG